MSFSSERTQSRSSYDFSKLSNEDLNRFIFANALARNDSVYTEWGNKAAKSFASAGFWTDPDMLASTLSVHADTPMADPFDLSSKTTSKVFCVVFKGSDDILDFVRDISKEGVRDAASEGRKHLFGKLAKDVADNIERHDKISIAGHSLGGYLAAEFLCYLKATKGDAWWKQNAGKIEITTIDPIGFSDEYTHTSWDPASQRHLAVKGTVAELSRTMLGGNGLHDPMALNKAGRPPVTFQSPTGWHASGDIRDGLVSEAFQRQRAEGRDIRCPSFEVASDATVYRFKPENVSQQALLMFSEIPSVSAALLMLDRSIAKPSGAPSLIHEPLMRKLGEFRRGNAGRVETEVVNPYPGIPR